MATDKEFELKEFEEGEVTTSSGGSNSPHHRSPRFGEPKNFGGIKIPAIFDRYFRHSLRFIVGNMRRGFLFKALMIFLLGCIVILGFHPHGQKTVRDVGYYYYSTLNSYSSVANKKDLLGADVSSLLKYKKWDKSPITNQTISQEYLTYPVKAYVFNLEREGSIAKREDVKSADVESSSKVEDKEFDKQNDFKSHSCKELTYVNNITYSKVKRFMEDDLIEARSYVLSMNNMYSKAVWNKDEKDWSEEKIIKERWYRYSASSIWVPKLNCYLVFTRLVYSSEGRKNEPKISMVRGQAFDKNWKELKKFRVPYDDVPIPEDIDQQVIKLKKDLGVDGCQRLKKDKNAYDRCKVEQANRLRIVQKKIDTIMRKYYVTYPTVFNIPFDTLKKYQGQEDPKVVLKQNGGLQEPVVVFNHHDAYENKRRMAVFFPHRKSDPFLKLKAHNFKLNDPEKNWTPFFHTYTGDTKLTRGYIHFIYKFFPLEILKCSLDDGSCEKVFQSSTIEASQKKTKFDEMRGGTEFVQLPPSLPKVAGKQIWVGFPKLHIRDCGCGPHFYRPMLSVLIESNGMYHFELVAPVVDFQMEILSWDQKDTYCQDNNLLAANSVMFWEVVGQDSVTKSYDDYMGLTVSESDILTRVVYLKGVLDYVLGIYKDKNIAESIVFDSHTRLDTEDSFKCIIQESKDQCKAYGESHPEPVKE